jgi:ABC-type lipoprotein release transport system permease subunit
LTREPGLAHWEEGVFVNAVLAQRLGIQTGDEILVRVEKPGRVSRDMALAVGSDTAAALRVRVQGVLPDAAGGRFDLRNVHGAPANVYLPLERLQALAGAAGQINRVLCSGDDTDTTTLDAAVGEAWQLEDVGLQVWEVPERNTIELRSRQVFLDDAVAGAALALSPTGTGVFAYLVNSIVHGARATPYSFVCGSAAAPAAGLAPDALVATDWLAEDLGLTPGAAVRLDYFVMGPLRTLVETSAVFKVERIVALKDTADPTLMPDIPGVAATGDCRDWESGLPIDVKRIRPKDEEYWDAWRGSPKAYVALGTAQALWDTPWGRLTAVRWSSQATSAVRVEAGLMQRLSPAQFGLVFRDVAAQARRSVEAAMDFRQLFLGLSFFLVVAALMLVWLLFRLTLERRQAQAGLLLSCGAAGTLTRWLMMEGLLVAGVGALAGVAAGVAYAQAMIGGLVGAWRGAVTGLAITLEVRAGTLALAWCGVVLLAGVVMAAGIRALRRRTVHALLSGTGDESGPRAGRGWAVTALTALGGAAALWALAWTMDERSRAGVFFGVGALVLLGLSAAFGWRLRHGQRRHVTLPTTIGLGLREAARHPLRSVLVSGLTATNQPAAPARFERTSGTGGFAWLGEPALPIHADMNTAAGRALFGLQEAELAGVSFVGLRLHAADDASCLNLNRAQQPQVAGVDPEALAVRGAFRFARSDLASHPSSADGWRRLAAALPDGVVPAVADEPTLVWGLGLGVGDELESVDGQGRRFRLKFVGMLESTILQGTVLIDEARFAQLFPGDTGYAAWLIDTPPAQADAVGGLLTRVFRREGLACVSTVDRMETFAEVTKSYLAMFRTLGGLGVILGVVGLAVILVRHVVERRGALALLRAVGIRRRRVAGMLVGEQMGLAVAGIVNGLAAALMAMGPSFGGSVEPGVIVGLAGWALAVLAAGLAATALAAWLVTRGRPFDALRNE